MSKLFSENGKPLYRIHTGMGTTKYGGDPFILYDVMLSPEYKEICEKRGKLGDLPGGNKVTPEALHRADHLAESVVIQADAEGIVDTDVRDIALRVMRAAPESRLDKGSPQDILDILEEEERVKKLSPSERAREQAKKQVKAPATK